MRCLGIESTAHTFGVAIVEKDISKESVYEGWTFKSNVRKAFVTKEGGMIPAEVADHHTEHCHAVLEEALAKAGITMQDIDLIAWSQGPGIGNMLRVGSALARSLALRFNKPLIGVNHCVAHLEIGRILSGFDDPILLYASGANTQVIGFESGKYRVFGETLDIGVGNLLDQVAREMGLGFPGGPEIERLAKNGEYYVLPYSVKGMDVQFGGLATHLKRDIAADKKQEDIACALQETAFAMLTEISERALAHTGKSQLILGGGVACNARLQEMCKLMCEERGAKSFAPAREFLVDNAGMIAATGILMRIHGGETLVQDATMHPHERTDDIAVYWR